MRTASEQGASYDANHLSRKAAVRRVVLSLAGVGGFVALLEAVPRLGLVPPDYLPPASRIAVALTEEAGQQRFWVALADTARTWGIGLAIAVGAGIVAGV